MPTIKRGSIILTPLPQADGKTKLRPALILSVMPPFNDYLVCGISSNKSHYTKGFDEIITESDNDYKKSGLLNPSLIRLGFLTVLPKKNIAGTIGHISNERCNRLLRSLSNYIIKDIN